MSNQLSPIHCISGNLQQAARAVSRTYAEEMRPSGIQRSQFTILASLMNLEAITLTKLADKLFMERTTLTRNLTPLVKQGLVRVKPADGDARVREINITNLGVKKYRVAVKFWQKAQEKLLNKFGKKNWRELENSLHILRELVT